MMVIFAARGNEPSQEASLDELPRLLEDPQVKVWVEISGPKDETAVRVLRDVFEFHPLAIEDCFGAREHPKAEAYEGYVYVITHGLAEGSNAERHETVEL